MQACCPAASPALMQTCSLAQQAQAAGHKCRCAAAEIIMPCVRPVTCVHATHQGGCCACDAMLQLAASRSYVGPRPAAPAGRAAPGRAALGQSVHVPRAHGRLQELSGHSGREGPLRLLRVLHHLPRPALPIQLVQPGVHPACSDNASAAASRTGGVMHSRAARSQPALPRLRRAAGAHPGDPLPGRAMIPRLARLAPSNGLAAAASRRRSSLCLAASCGRNMAAPCTRALMAASSRLHCAARRSICSSASSSMCSCLLHSRSSPLRASVPAALLLAGSGPAGWPLAELRSLLLAECELRSLSVPRSGWLPPGRSAELPAGPTGWLLTEPALHSCLLHGTPHCQLLSLQRCLTGAWGRLWGRKGRVPALMPCQGSGADGSKRWLLVPRGLCPGMDSASTGERASLLEVQASSSRSAA